MKLKIKLDNQRNLKLTPFGKAILKDRYLIDNESYQDFFARISNRYSDNQSHAQRLYDYMSNLWFMPSTPILNNARAKRGVPISCFLNETENSLDGFLSLFNENIWIASMGGGIGSYWGNLTFVDQNNIKDNKNSNIFPFLLVQDSSALAISQGGLRRGALAIYLPINHPEIEEFIEIRRHTIYQNKLKALNIHHCVIINDDFMNKVELDEQIELINPQTKEVFNKIQARDLWIKILTARIETGEPYILFIDQVNRNIPEHHKKLGLYVKTSNLCNEVTLPTGLDHLNKKRTAICCLSSLNLEYFNNWYNNQLFIDDIMRFLDNCLQDFIDNAPSTLESAKYAASRERSVGLGVMGFHSLLQSQNIPFESLSAKKLNNKIFAYIKKEVTLSSYQLAKERGPCPDAAECGFMERFSNKTAIAPTASISVIAGESSPGIEPYVANSFTHKTLTGSFVVRNKHLIKLLEEKNMNNKQVWLSISTNKGSVQHLDFLTEHEKKVFKTAEEINQFWIIELASDRTNYICQSQSINLFLPADIDKRNLHQIHYQAWKKGLKSLYYCRSKSIQRADENSNKITK